MADLLAFALDRDAVRVAGPDALAFLQGQLSQDLAPLAVGQSVESLILQPQGKVDAYVRVTRTAEDELVLDVDGGFGEAVRARLQRFKLRTRADIEPLGWRFVGLRSPVGPPEAWPDAATAGAGAGQRVLPVAWPGPWGVDLAGPEVAPPAGVALGTAEQYEALRIHAGQPAMGRELTDKTIPAESGLVERTVSFTKGCFTGQELVARIDARGGNVPRHLRGLVLEGGTPPGPGAPVEVDGAEVGAVTSGAWSHLREAPVALAYVKRDVPVEVDAAVAGAPARIVSLPIPA